MKVTRKGAKSMVIKKSISKYLSLVILFAAVGTAVLTGCEKDDDIKSYVAEKEGEYTVYYTAKELNGIYSYVYESEETDSNKLISQLLGELEKGDYEGTKEPVIPKELSAPDFRINYKGVVTVDFAGTYSNLEGMDELLMRACIVKTLCQVKVVNGVEFYIEGSPLVLADGVVVTESETAQSNLTDDRQDSHAKTVGVMNQYDFVSSVTGDNSSGDGKGTSQSDILTLYYADESGKGLESAYLRVEYDNNISPEQLVVSQLIEGPVTDKCYRAVNEDTVINKISTKEKVCFVDLSSDFLNVPDNVTLDVSVYSVVDSLLELPAVTKVKILIDGEVYTQFADDGLMDRNYLIINE